MSQVTSAFFFLDPEKQTGANKVSTIEKSLSGSLHKGSFVDIYLYIYACIYIYTYILFIYICIYIYRKEEWATRDKNTDEMGESDRSKSSDGSREKCRNNWIIIRNPGWSVFGSIAFIPIYSTYQKEIKKVTKRVEWEESERKFQFAKFRIFCIGKGHHTWRFIHGIDSLTFV